MNKERKDNQGIVLPPAFRIAIRILDFIHPYLSMRFAAFFFSKPFRYKFLEHEVPVLIKAIKSSVKIKTLDKSILCYRWEGKGPKIILMHGWSGRATNFYKIIDELIKQDYDIYAFDAPAHGKSPGLSTNIPEFTLVLDYLVKLWGPFESMLGHSGGAFTSAYVCADHSEIKKLILISPFDRAIDLFDKYYNLISLSETAQKLMLDYFSQKTNRKITEFSGAFSARSIEAKTLIIHDENDKEVDLSNSVTIKKNIKRGRLYITKGLGHRRILRDEKVIQEIISFLTS